MTGFNLVDEPWIPCARGDTIEDLSLRDVCRRAAALDEISDASPLTTVALYRLLLAILHRVLGPADPSEWRRLWQAGGWDPDPVESYLDRWRDRFDLLHPGLPFYQSPQIVAEPSPIRKLTHELGPANHGHFSHVTDSTDLTLTCARAARYLLAYQLFSPGGLVSLQRGEDPKKYKSARAAPLAGSAVCLTNGGTLAQTLLLNMVRYDPARGYPFRGAGDDCPVWERPGPVEAADRIPDGYLDWLTWPSRRIRLFAAERDGEPVVTRVLIMKGAQLPPDVFESRYEQMVAYRKNERAKPGQNPYPPVGFQRDRAIWRDGTVLFHPVQLEGGDQSAGTVRAVAQSVPAFTLPLDLYGISLDQFNVLFWRRERLPLAPAYLTDEDLYAQLQQGLGFAEGVAGVLRWAARRLAERLLAPEGTRQPDPNAVGDLVESMGATRRYWSRLEAPFSRYLVDQAAAWAADGEAVDESGPLLEWVEVVRAAARESFGEVMAGAGSSGWALKAAVEAERILNVGVAKEIAHRRLRELRQTEVVHERA